jgi:hypothetical protein
MDGATAVEIEQYNFPVLRLAWRERGAICGCSKPDIRCKIARLTRLPTKGAVDRANQSKPTPALEVVLSDLHQFLKFVIAIYP